MAASSPPPSREREPPALGAARASGLVRAGEPLLVMLSGGADSTCLLDVAKRLGARPTALHVNYGLRPESRADEEHCRELCAALGVDLVVERVELPDGGNLQAAAREARYALAARHAPGDYAAAHTLSDQAETVVYRLATSPGRRALLGMAPRRGRLVRPLLTASRSDTLGYCRAHGLPWREDRSNADPRYARARVRAEVMPVLSALARSAERTIAETSAHLRDEAAVLEQTVDSALGRLGGTAGVQRSELEREPPALRRLVLRRMAEMATGEDRSLSRKQADALLELGRAGGSARLDLGGGLLALAEYGTLRFSLATGEHEAPEPVALTVPGAARFGGWVVDARIGRGGDEELAAEALGRSAVVRAWSDGDRIRPPGLGGTKSLQDLFTDRKVPRGLRRGLPVVEARGEIAWVAGVAVGERFRARAGSEDDAVVSLSARRAAGV